MHRKLALDLDDLNVDSLDVVFGPDDSAYAASIIIRTNTEPYPERTSPTNCCA